MIITKDSKPKHFEPIQLHIEIQSQAELDQILLLFGSFSRKDLAIQVAKNKERQVEIDDIQAGTDVMFEIYNTLSEGDKQ